LTYIVNSKVLMTVFLLTKISMTSFNLYPLVSALILPLINLLKLDSILRNLQNLMLQVDPLEDNLK